MLLGLRIFSCSLLGVVGESCQWELCAGSPKERRRNANPCSGAAGDEREVTAEHLPEPRLVPQGSRACGAVLARPAAASALGSFGGGGGWGHVGPRTCSVVPGPRGTAGFLLLLLTAKLSGSASLLCQPCELQLVPAGVGSKPCCSLKRWVFPFEK